MRCYCSLNILVYRCSRHHLLQTDVEQFTTAHPFSPHADYAEPTQVQEHNVPPKTFDLAALEASMHEAAEEDPVAKLAMLMQVCGVNGGSSEAIGSLPVTASEVEAQQLSCVRDVAQGSGPSIGSAGQGGAGLGDEGEDEETGEVFIFQPRRRGRGV
jgi:hypothetical protein